MFSSTRRRYFTLAGILGYTAIAGASAFGAKALMGNDKKSTPQAPPPAPSVPTPETAEGKAKEEMLKKRRIQQRSGGKTILSSEYGSATGSTLLGE